MANFIIKKPILYKQHILLRLHKVKLFKSLKRGKKQ